MLIVGFGKMGRVHARHLAELQVPWDYHDPFVPGGVGLSGLAGYTHIVVATPLSTHYDVYRRLSWFDGQILIEKPVVVRREHLHVLDDPRVFPGLCERFNPAFQSLKADVGPDEVVAVEFRRASPAPDVSDIGIHDIDLFCHLLELRRLPGFRWERDVLVVDADGVEGRFHWPQASRRIRTLSVTTRSSRREVDLLATCVDGRIVWPVSGELQSFLSGDRLDARVSHELLVRALAAR